MNDSGHIGGQPVNQPLETAIDFGGTVGSNAADLALLTHLRETGLLDHYRVPGPAMISFSGGRTSAFMLWLILQAYGGKLPDNIYVCYANTGKEREETLQFVHDVETHWGVKVWWLEWRHPEEVEQRFVVVDFETANRDGRYFGQLIDGHNVLPNPLVRYCTKELKIRTLHRFMRAQGVQDYKNVVGLRADEMHRVLRLRESKEHKDSVAPMAAAGTTEYHVLKFFGRHPFDLGIEGFKGNCDNCFLKRRGTLRRLCRENPTSFDWWIEQESKKGEREDGAGGHLFRDTTSYAAIKSDALSSPLLPMFDEDDGEEEHDVECGLLCDMGTTAEDISNSADNLVDFAAIMGDPRDPQSLVSRISRGEATA